MLPTHYFHITVTVPEELRAVLRANQRDGYAALMKTAAEAIIELARDPRHVGGIVGVWVPGQNGQIQSGAVLTLNSGRRPPGCRGARCAGYPEAAATSPTSHPIPIVPIRGRVRMPRSARRPQPPRHNDGLALAPQRGATASDHDRNGKTEISGSTSAEQTRVNPRER